LGLGHGLLARSDDSALNVPRNLLRNDRAGEQDYD